MLSQPLLHVVSLFIVSVKNFKITKMGLEKSPHYALFFSLSHEWGEDKQNLQRTIVRTSDPHPQTIQ